MAELGDEISLSNSDQPLPTKSVPSTIRPVQEEEVSSKSHLFEDIVEELVCLHCERRNRKRRWAKHIEKCLGTASLFLLAKKGAMLTADHP